MRSKVLAGIEDYLLERKDFRGTANTTLHIWLAAIEVETDALRFVASSEPDPELRLELVRESQVLKTIGAAIRDELLHRSKHVH